MKILVTGSSNSGSWLVRAVQLGEAIGATVMRDAIDPAKFDIAVVVKRPHPMLIDRIRRAGVPLVYDIVDAWPQPNGNQWSRGTCLEWLCAKVNEIRPAAIVAATRAMAEDCSEFGVPVLALRHHARPGIEQNPIREQVRNVGYEGGFGYLGPWRATLEAECKFRGWTFHVNPQMLADLDIVVAMREATGYAPRKWKSNVKLANAQGSGTPCVMNREAGYLETASGGEVWADSASELTAAFDELTPYSARRAASGNLLAAAPSLERIAKDYRAWLEKVCSLA